METGHYEFNRRPFGFCNEPVTFQRYMDKLFRGKEDFILSFLVYVIVFSKTKLNLNKHLNEVFKLLKDVKVILNNKMQSLSTLIGYFRE